MGAVDHLQKLVVVQSFMNPFSDALKFFEVDDSVFILVEDGEDSLQALFCFGFSNFVSDNFEELFESDWFVLVSETSDQTQNEGISFVDTQLFECFLDLNGINATTVVFIEDFESVLEIFVVFGGESVFPVGGCWLVDFARVGLGLDVGSAHNIRVQSIIFNIVQIASSFRQSKFNSGQQKTTHFSSINFSSFSSFFLIAMPYQLKNTVFWRLYVCLQINNCQLYRSIEGLNRDRTSTNNCQT